MPRIIDWEDLKGEDYLDTRTIIEKYDELVAEIEAEQEADEDYEPSWEAQKFMEEVDSLRNEVSEFEDGATLILDTSFEDYAREFASDIGAISGDEGWPLNCIDWEKAARELQMDYSGVRFMGYDYLVRS